MRRTLSNKLQTYWKWSEYSFHWSVSALTYEKWKTVAELFKYHFAVPCYAMRIAHISPAIKFVCQYTCTGILTSSCSSMAVLFTVFQVIWNSLWWKIHDFHVLSPNSLDRCDFVSPGVFICQNWNGHILLDWTSRSGQLCVWLWTKSYTNFYILPYLQICHKIWQGAGKLMTWAQNSH